MTQTMPNQGEEQVCFKKIISKSIMFPIAFRF